MAVCAGDFTITITVGMQSCKRAGLNTCIIARVVEKILVKLVIERLAIEFY